MVTTKNKLDEEQQKLLAQIEESKFGTLGGLLPVEEDHIELHTAEAYRLFLGRRKSVDKNNNPIYPVTGTRRAASALRQLWLKTALDNPYADWYLVAAMMRYDQVLMQIQDEQKNLEEIIAKQKLKGIHISCLTSTNPIKVHIGFRSPYGFKLANINAEYDYLVRLIKTLVRRGLLTDDQGLKRIKEGGKNIRSIYEPIVKYANIMFIPDVATLRRSDYLPDAPKRARERAERVTSSLGAVDNDIFTKTLKPAHSLNKDTLTKDQLALIEQELDQIQKAKEMVTDESDPDEKLDGLDDVSTGENDLLSSD